MSFYKVEYKTRADDDHDEWRLGQHPTREGALMSFNESIRRKRGFLLRLDRPDDFLGDYFLVEMEEGHDRVLTERDRIPLHET